MSVKSPVFVCRFLVSVCYSKAKLAAACAGIVYFLSYVPYMYVAIREEAAGDKISAWAKSLTVSRIIYSYDLGLLIDVPSKINQPAQSPESCQLTAHMCWFCVCICIVLIMGCEPIENFHHHQEWNKGMRNLSIVACPTSFLGNCFEKKSLPSHNFIPPSSVFTPSHSLPPATLCPSTSHSLTPQPLTLSPPSHSLPPSLHFCSLHPMPPAYFPKGQKRFVMGMLQFHLMIRDPSGPEKADVWYSVNWGPHLSISVTVFHHRLWSGCQVLCSVWDRRCGCAVEQCLSVASGGRPVQPLLGDADDDIWCPAVRTVDVVHRECPSRSVSSTTTCCLFCLSPSVFVMLSHFSVC